MKHFLYVDNDFINSIIAQTNKGLITEISENIGKTEEEQKTEEIDGSIKGGLDGNVPLFIQANIDTAVNGKKSTTESLTKIGNQVVSRIMHDAAFDYAYDAIKDSMISLHQASKEDCGKYMLLVNKFTYVDFGRTDELLCDDGIISFVKQQRKTEAEEIKNKQKNGLIEKKKLNSDQCKDLSRLLDKQMEEALRENDKQIEEMRQIIKLIRNIVPCNRMLVSNDGYIIPLEEEFFRVNANSFGLMYGGRLSCVGMVTNVIGVDADEEGGVFAKLQQVINSVLVGTLQPKERKLCVIHPIAVYYE